MIKLIQRLIGSLKTSSTREMESDYQLRSKAIQEKETLLKQKEQHLKERYLRLIQFRNALKSSYEKFKSREILLAEKAEKINEERDQLIEQRKELRSSVTYYEEKIQVLTERYEHAQIEIARLNQVNIGYQNDVLKLSDDLREIQVEFENQKILTEKLRVVDPLSETKIDRTEEIENLKALIRELNSEKAELSRLSEMLKYDKKELLDEIELYKSKMNTLIIENEKIKLENKLTKEELRDEIESNKSKIKLLISENKKIRLENQLIKKELKPELKKEYDKKSEQIYTRDQNIREDSVSGENRDRIIAPINIGPRRNINRQTVNDANNVDRSYTPISKFICWKNGWEWQIGIEVPEQLGDVNELRVEQNNQTLQIDNYRERCYKITQSTGLISIKNSQDIEQKIQLSQTDILLFKLSSGNMNEGNFVKNTNHGNYLAIVPKSWISDGDSGAETISEPESVCISDLTAYHFYIQQDTNAKIIFKDLNGEIKSVSRLKKFYDLQGNILENCSDKQGALFGDELPEIIIRDSNLQTKTVSIIIGEEGAEQRGWRKQIFSNNGFDKIDLSERYPEIRSGWYFLRFYDEDDNLLDSCDFRFISSLKKISTLNNPDIPIDGSHLHSSFEFEHDGTLIIAPEKDKRQDFEILETSPSNKIIIVQPNPLNDKVELSIRSSSGRPVNLVMPLNQIWWKVAENESSESWQDKLIMLDKEDFKSNPKNLFIKIPFLSRITEVKFGFRGRELRAFNVKQDSKVVRISLEGFSDSEIEMNSFGSFDLSCKFTINDKIKEFIPCKLVSLARCKFCFDYTAESPSDLSNHIFEAHFNEFFTEPKYEDVQKLLPRLPEKIYKCVHCPENEPTFVASDINNSPELICRHTERKHPNAPVIILIEDDIETIKKYLMLDIPDYKLCVRCRVCIEEHNLKAHLIEKHSKEIYEEIK